MRPTEPPAEPRSPRVPELVGFFYFLRMGSGAGVSYGLESCGVEGGGGWHVLKEENMWGNWECGVWKQVSMWHLDHPSLGLGGSWASPQHLHSYRIKTLMATSRRSWLHHRSGHVCFKGRFFILCFTVSWISVWTRSFQQVLSLHLEET